MNIVRALLQSVGNLFRWWIIVVPWEQALRVRSGKRVTHLHAGIHFKIPLWDRIYLQSTRLRLVNLPSQTLMMKDGRIVVVSARLGYSIQDLLLLYQTLDQPDGTISSMAAARFAEVMAGLPSENDLGLEALGDKVASGLDFMRFGLCDVSFHITDFAYVKTYRLITGSADGWDHGAPLKTHVHDGQA